MCIARTLVAPGVSVASVQAKAPSLNSKAQRIDALAQFGDVHRASTVV